ncbi:MAG: holo-ACP synthase [bacterium]|nr:holo-ACP synthase [bacterium]
MNAIVGIGIDIVEVGRIEAAMARHPARFAARVFTDGEVAYCENKRNKFQHYAARFAAKEAAMKALGTGWGGGVAFSQIEVVHAPSGRPDLRLHDRAGEIFQASGATVSFLSLSHTDAYGAAQVILSR